MGRSIKDTAMTPTLLEFAVGVVLLVVAWQIGITIAPWIIQEIRGLKTELDEVAEEVVPNQTEEVNPAYSEKSGSNHNYKNN
jgi:hypothetical protein